MSRFRMIISDPESPHRRTCKVPFDERIDSARLGSTMFTSIIVTSTFGKVAEAYGRNIARGVRYAARCNISCRKRNHKPRSDRAPSSPSGPKRITSVANESWLFLAETRKHFVNCNRETLRFTRQDPPSRSHRKYTAI